MSLSASAALAQVLATMPPTPQQAPWGGYSMATPVPYEPTMSAGIVAPPPLMTGATWQSYPNSGGPNQAVMPDNVAPGVVPSVVPTDPGHSVTSDPDLKKSLTPPGARDGFFQKVDFDATWIPAPDSNSIGWTDLHADVVTALPFFTRENPIIITPSYTSHWLDGPTTPDLPSHLNDFSMDFHIFRVYDNHWVADFAMTPGLFADDHSLGSSEAWRVNGSALGVYAPTINLKYALGVTYLDGGWSKIVPVAGVIYTPTDDVEYQLVFPTPRISWRLNNFTPVPGSDERWVYVTLDYGNEAWAFKDPNGASDVLASRDYRVMFGFERRIVGGISHRVEIGYVFNRNIKVASISGDDISQGSTLLLRAGVSY
jgi:hypothetical protein